MEGLLGLVFVCLVLFMAQKEVTLLPLPTRLADTWHVFSRQVETMNFDPETLFLGTKQEDVLSVSSLAANQVGKLQYYC